MSKAFVAGVGMIPFVKPGASESHDVMAASAGRLALADAGKLVLSPGQTGDDAFLRAMRFYAKGVEGQVPA